MIDRSVKIWHESRQKPAFADYYEWKRQIKTVIVTKIPTGFISSNQQLVWISGLLTYLMRWKRVITRRHLSRNRRKLQQQRNSTYKYSVRFPSWGRNTFSTLFKDKVRLCKWNHQSPKIRPRMRAHTGDKDKYLENLQTLPALLHICEYRCVKYCPFQTFTTNMPELVR